jgi:thioglycine synthase
MKGEIRAVIKWSWHRSQDKRQDEKQEQRNQQSLNLVSRRKWTTTGTSRIQPSGETLKRIIPISKEIGVTRVAHLDRLYIANCSVVLPGTEDKIWVYSGKGPTKQHAMASALMECIERYSSLPSANSKRHFITGSFEELSKKYKVLHPVSVIEPLSYQYKNEMVMDFVPSFDLLSKEEVLVPAGLALYRYSILSKKNPSGDVKL